MGTLRNDQRGGQYFLPIHPPASVGVTNHDLDEGKHARDIITWLMLPTAVIARVIIKRKDMWASSHRANWICSNLDIAKCSLGEKR